MSKISISIDSQLIGELFLRLGRADVDVNQIVEDVLTDFLERTMQDGPWADVYYEWVEKKSGNDLNSCGDPKLGYSWGSVFLPNGTKIRMDYKGTTHHAEVKFQNIYYKDEVYSPSELASKIAAGTSRNAWRDLMIKRQIGRAHV